MAMAHQLLASCTKGTTNLGGKGSSWDKLVQSIRFFEEQTRLCESGSLNAVGNKDLCWNVARQTIAASVP